MEDERRRVARELHDDVSQKLAMLEVSLEQLVKDCEGVDVRAHLGEVTDSVRVLSNDLRRISHRLHPSGLDELGLSYSLKALVEEFGERFNMPATFAPRNLPADIPQNAAAALYRITQEALRNVAKHAGRTHVKVSLEGHESKLRLEIADLGEGFDTENRERGLGLISMKERTRLLSGQFLIRSGLGSGTTIIVDVPLTKEDS
jgi:two-component system CheB/CheR fusion protein